MIALARRYSSWIWLAVALAVVGVITAVATPQSSDTPLGVHNAKPDGGLALYTWLSRTGYHVHAGTDLNSHELSRTQTLLLLAPQADPSRATIIRLRRWVRNGGHLVLGTDGTTWRTFDAFGMHLVPAASNPARVIQPLLMAPPASRLSGSTAVVGEESPAAGEVAATDFGPVLVHRGLGRGELWLFTAPNLLDNREIARAQNRRLAINLVGPPGTDVGFVELPAAAVGPTDWLTGTAWGIALIFSLIVFLLYRWAAGWRLGPPVIPFHERRRPAVEYVISLADLLRRARKRTEILRIYQRRLRHFLSRRYGSELPADLPPVFRDEVERLLNEPPSLSEEDLIERAASIVQCEEQMRSTGV